MRHFLRQSIEGGRCGGFNQYYRSSLSNEVFIIISKELNVNGNVCENLEKYFEYTIKHMKLLEHEYGSPFNDYRDND